MYQEQIEDPAERGEGNETVELSFDRPDSLHRMPKIDLPPVIEKYFAAKESGDAEVTLTLFAENATVWDNGEDLMLEGKDSIRQWMTGTVAEYKLTSEVKSVEETDGGCEARVVVSGDFPGSPYEFAYRFKLQDGMISELAIDPIGSLAE